MMKVTLPKVRSEVDRSWRNQKFGMIGPSGIGKSEFWSHANGLYLQFEAGLNHLEVMKQPIRSYDELKATYGALLEAKNAGDFPWDTIIIDTIDRMIDIVDAEVIQLGKSKYKAVEINSKYDIPNGNGWAWSSELVENILRKLEDLPAAIVYIGHLENKEVKEPTRSIHKQTISIGGKMGGNLAAWPDHFLNVTADFVGTEKVRVVRTMPTQTIEAKSRGGIIPDNWRWSADSKANFEKMRGLFT